MKDKKALWITLIILDVALTVGLLVIAIIMLARNATMTKAEIIAATGFIAYLQKNPMVYGLCFVVPLFILLGVNIYALTRYVRATSKKEEVQMNDLSEEQKEQLRQELLKELQNPKE